MSSDHSSFVMMKSPRSGLFGISVVMGQCASPTPVTSFSVQMLDATRWCRRPNHAEDCGGGQQQQQQQSSEQLPISFNDSSCSSSSLESPICAAIEERLATKTGVQETLRQWRGRAICSPTDTVELDAPVCEIR